MARTPAVKGPSKSLSVTIPQPVYEFLDAEGLRRTLNRGSACHDVVS